MNLKVRNQRLEEDLTDLRIEIRLLKEEYLEQEMRLKQREHQLELMASQMRSACNLSRDAIQKVEDLNKRVILLENNSESSSYGELA